VHSAASDPHRVIENDVDASGGNRLDLVAELPKLIVVQCGVYYVGTSARPGVLTAIKCKKRAPAEKYISTGLPSYFALWIRRIANQLPIVYGLENVRHYDLRTEPKTRTRVSQDISQH